MTSENELDKQFQEDLEKARALSLETLALEKFRLQKIQEEKRKGNYSHLYLCYQFIEE